MHIAVPEHGPVCGIAGRSPVEARSRVGHRRPPCRDLYNRLGLGSITIQIVA